MFTLLKLEVGYYSSAEDYCFLEAPCHVLCQIPTIFAFVQICEQVFFSLFCPKGIFI